MNRQLLINNSILQENHELLGKCPLKNISIEKSVSRPIYISLKAAEPQYTDHLFPKNVLYFYHGMKVLNDMITLWIIRRLFEDYSKVIRRSFYRVRKTYE